MFFFFKEIYFQTSLKAKEYTRPQKLASRDLFEKSDEDFALSTCAFQVKEAHPG